MADQYVSALASGEPTQAPLSGDLAFVENLDRLSPGRGLWGSISSPDQDFALTIPDPELGQVGWYGLLEREGELVLLALRLKVEGGSITEAEHLYVAPAGDPDSGALTLRPNLHGTIPPEDQLSHAELAAIGASYYDALDDNDGSRAPFAPDCQRIENGMITAGEGAMAPPDWEPGRPRTASDCAAQISSQAFTYIDRIEHRRIVAADPETGLVMGISQFRHPMNNLPYMVTLADGSVSERNRENMPYDPFDMAAAHIFKVGPEGQIHEIEAVGVTAPYNSPTGWE